MQRKAPPAPAKPVRTILRAGRRENGLTSDFFDKLGVAGLRWPKRDAEMRAKPYI